MPEPADLLPPLRDVIAAHDLAARKSLGQNFLLDLNLTRRIARAAGPLEGATIYEVGPGPGRLEIVSDDALKIGESELLRTRSISGPVRVAANLPYNVGTALLVKWLTA